MPYRLIQEDLPQERVLSLNHAWVVRLNCHLPPNVNRLSCRPPAGAGVQPTTQLSIAGVAGQLQPLVSEPDC